jgi:site-specific DNA-methyltransferase (adenine-specific)/modification methylase
MSTPWKRKEIIGDCTLYLGDCMEVMPTLGKVDAVVTDPPYGIGYDKHAAKVSGKKGKAAKKREYRQTDWDSTPCSSAALELMRENSKNQIIFGGNYFELPPTRCWLIWDKENGSTDFADAELAWTNITTSTRLLRHMWNGMLRKGQEPRNNHPTQKPVGVMEWCLKKVPDAETILDPFMGSGTTLVACAKLGRSGIGIELDEDYFNIACERVEKAYSQADLFVAPPENKDIKRNQVSMFDDGDAA